MTDQLLSLLAVVGSLVIAIAVQAMLKNWTYGARFTLSARDAVPAEKSVMLDRANRVVDNTREFIAIFAPLVIIAHLVQASGPLVSLACLLTACARFIYIPAYLSGVPGLRSLVWALSAVSLPVLAWAILSS